MRFKVFLASVCFGRYIWLHTTGNLERIEHGLEMTERGPRQQLREVLVDIIEGRIVKRTKHHLRWNDENVAGQFVEELVGSGYLPTIVHEIHVEPGERVPAFYIEDETAYFGWVFWEKFTQLKLRKLFGSVVRNQKGDWAIQIPPNQKTTIYANLALKNEMDIDNPSGF